MSTAMATSFDTVMQKLPPKVSNESKATPESQETKEGPKEKVVVQDQPKSLAVQDGDFQHSNTWSFDDIAKIALKDKSPKELVKAAQIEAKEAQEQKNNTENEAKPKENKEVEAKPKGKQFSYKVGDVEASVPSDAIFTHKVDGKEANVNLQELLNNYSGKVSWEKKFNEVANEKKAFQQEIKQIEGYIEDFRVKATSKDKDGNQDLFGAMEYITEMAGMDPLSFRQNLRKQVLSQAAKLSGMTPEQIAILEKDEQIEFLSRKDKARLVKDNEAQQKAELDKKLLNIKSTTGASDEMLQEAFDALDKELPQGIQITAEHIENKLGSLLLRDKVTKIVEAVDPKILTDSPHAVMDLTQILNGQNVDDERIRNIVDEVYAKPKREAKAVSDKVREQSPKSTKDTLPIGLEETPRYSTEVAKTKKTLTSFDQI